mmetsp:Transcript_4061/g.6728  ORF Transcript_4061/g.6728 Transcript_4061/m.6728 type:complete len:181 (-) Transcript_4061:118-660(-)
MNLSSKVSTYRSVIFGILCIAAVSRRHYTSVDAFVPQTILTRKQIISSPITIVPNQQHHHNQIRNKYILTPNNMAVTTSSDEELHNEINSMKAKDIRQELQSYGISTKSFFEKSEFVRAVAEARVDGVKQTSTTAGSSSSSSSSRVKEEPRDPSYRDVAVSKFAGDKTLLGRGVIDIKAR